MVPQQCLCQLQVPSTQRHSRKEWCACGTAVLGLEQLTAHRLLDFSQAAFLLCGYWSQPCLILRSLVCYPQCPVPLQVSF
ncbi:hypothetical protein DV515_00006602, partial [Chloebia gouldiae]